MNVADELAIIVGAELTLLVSIVAMKIYFRRREVLGGPYIEPSSCSVREEEGFDQTFSARDASDEVLLGSRPHPASSSPDRPSRITLQIKGLPIQCRKIIARWTKRRWSPPLLPQSFSAFANPLPENTVLDKADTVPIVRSSESFRAPATLSSGIRIYAVGDIHGRADLLRTTLEKIDADRSSRPVKRSMLVFLGDYVDRGPSSKEVIDLLLECKKTRESVFLKGNHETFISDFLKYPAVLDSWRTCGGLQTLLSYGVNPALSRNEVQQRKLAESFALAIPSDHVAFLQSLQLFFQCGEFLFVHAGVRPNLPLEQQEEKDLLWIREEFLEYEKSFGLFVVHGHTPISVPELRSNRLNIDTGAFATGRLTCVAIEGSTIIPL